MVGVRTPGPHFLGFGPPLVDGLPLNNGHPHLPNELPLPVNLPLLFEEVVSSRFKIVFVFHSFLAFVVVP